MFRRLLGLGSVLGLILFGTLSLYYNAHSITLLMTFGTVTTAFKDGTSVTVFSVPIWATCRPMPEELQYLVYTTYYKMSKQCNDHILTYVVSILSYIQVYITIYKLLMKWGIQEV